MPGFHSDFPHSPRSSNFGGIIGPDSAAFINRIQFRSHEFGIVLGAPGDGGGHQIQVADRAHPHSGMKAWGGSPPYLPGEIAPIGFAASSKDLGFLFPKPKQGSAGGGIKRGPTKTVGITWSQMEGTPERSCCRWENQTTPLIYVSWWNYGGLPPSAMFVSKPATDLPFVATATPTQIGAYSPLYGFVMFTSKSGDQCIVHAYLDFNVTENTHYMVVICTNLADPTKSWNVAGGFGRAYLFSDWDQTSNTRTEPNQKRMAYIKEDHQIVVFGPSYSSTPYQYLYLFDAEDGFPHFSALDATKSLLNISFGQHSVMSAWWRSVKKVVPTVMIPTTVYPNPMIWMNPPTGLIDLSSTDEEYVVIWKKTKIEHISEGVTYTDFTHAQSLLKSIISANPEELVLDCSPNNNLRWPYSRKSRSYAFATIRGSGLDLGNLGHRMTLAMGVGYCPESGYFMDIWTTPENPATEISATSLDRYKYHAYSTLEISIVNESGIELYHDSIVSNGSTIFEDSGTFEYTSTAIPFTDDPGYDGTPFTVTSGLHVESADPLPDLYLSYDVIVEESSEITPGNIFKRSYLGYISELSQMIQNSREAISFSSSGVTGTIDPTVHVDDWEDPSPISYWENGEGFHYRNEWGVSPDPPPPSHTYSEKGTECTGYTMAPGTSVSFPVLGILQGTFQIFPLPVRNDRRGWAARLFTPSDTLAPGGVPLPSNAGGVFDVDGNFYLAYAKPEVWVRGCADIDRHFTFEEQTLSPYPTASRGRYSFYWSITDYRRVSALTGGVDTEELPYPTKIYTITGLEIYYGEDAFIKQEVKCGMGPVSETVYKTYLRKLKYTPGTVDSHGVQAPGSYSVEYDANIGHEFISPADTDGDYVYKTDARGEPIPIDEFTSYLPQKWFPLVSTPRPTLEQIWSITPIRTKFGGADNFLIIIWDKRVNNDINIESVPHCNIHNPDGSILTNIDISLYSDASLDTGTGLYQFNYYHHEEINASEALTARGGPEIICNHDNDGNTIALIKVWKQDRSTLEKFFTITTVFFTGDGISANSITIQEGVAGANGWIPYDTLKTLGSFSNCAFADVMHFYDLVSGTFYRANSNSESFDNILFPPGV